MPRQTTDQPITTRAARERLSPRRDPYFRSIGSGVTLGYRRGRADGTWVVRTMIDGRYQETALGKADDLIKADGASYLDFRQAEAKARAEAGNNHQRAAGLDPENPTTASYTVGDAAKDYILAYRRRGGKWERLVQNTINAHVIPQLGTLRLDRLTRSRVSQWRDALVDTAPRLRTGKTSLAGPNRRAIDTGDPETMRRRRATANRVLAILKAMLNHAHSEGKALGSAPWGQVKKYREVDLPRIRHLSDTEVVRLVNACERTLRDIVVAGMLTGLRYGEIGRLQGIDFNLEVGIVTVSISKSGKSRHV